MKNIIVFICLTTLTITINSCKPLMYYGCCDAGHAHWESSRYDTGGNANLNAAIKDHDANVHGGVGTAKLCTER